MKTSDLKGLAVINLETAEKIGTIQDLVLDLTAGRIVAFLVKDLKGDKELTKIGVQQVQNLGQDALTYKGRTTTLSQSQSADSQERAATMSSEVELSNFVHHEKLVTENGNLLGLVKDITIDPTNLTITAYEVTEGGLFAKTHVVRADPSIKFGPEIAIVPQQILPVNDQPNS